MSVSLMESRVVVPESIVAEILVRLPVKPLFRFKCVSKSWKEMISAPSLEVARKKLASDNLIIKHGNKMELYSGHELTRIKVGVYGADSFHLVGSYNGVVCFSTKLGGFDMILWNPTTGQTFEVPRNRHSHSSDHHRLCFSPPNSFSIVSIDTLSLHVYSLAQNSWADKGHTFRGTISEEAVVDGSPYWFARSVHGEALILAFDPATLGFNPISLPPANHVVRTSAVSLGGRLAVVAETQSGECEVWVMKECWTRMFVVPSFGCRFKCVWRNRVVFMVGKELAWYDVNRKSMETIFIVDSDSDSDSVNVDNVFSYAESVVSVLSPTPYGDSDLDSPEIPGTDWYIAGLTDMGVYY